MAQSSARQWCLVQLACAAAFGWIAYLAGSTDGSPGAVPAPVPAAGEHPSLAANGSTAADGLEALAAALDPEPLEKLGSSLGETADYLDQQLAPAAEATAGQLQETSERLAKEARLLASLLRAATVDLDIVQEVHDAIGRFAKGTDALAKVLELSRLPEIRNGLKGLESSLTSGAEQVEGLVAYTYPSVYFEGWRPRVTYKPFWPGGEKIASGMRQAAGGVKAADAELETLGKELPKVQTAVAASKQILERGQESLAVVIKNRHLIEPLVKSLPKTAAQLAEDLPKLTAELSKALHDTHRLRTVAAEMRAARDKIAAASDRWAKAEQALRDRAATLRQEADAALVTAPSFASASGSTSPARSDRRWQVLAWSLIFAAALIAFDGGLRLLRRKDSSRD